MRQRGEVECYGRCLYPHDVTRMESNLCTVSGIVTLFVNKHLLFIVGIIVRIGAKYNMDYSTVIMFMCPYWDLIVSDVKCPQIAELKTAAGGRGKGVPLRAPRTEELCEIWRNRIEYSGKIRNCRYLRDCSAHFSPTQYQRFVFSSVIHSI